MCQLLQFCINLYVCTPTLSIEAQASCRPRVEGEKSQKVAPHQIALIEIVVFMGKAAPMVVCLLVYVIGSLSQGNCHTFNMISKVVS